MRNKIEIQFKDGGTRPKSTKWGDLLHNKRVKLEKSGTQEWVFQSLMLLLEKENFDKITITKICDKAGINRSTFYRNYENKEDIVIKQLETDLGCITQMIENGSSENEVYHYVFTNCTYVLEVMELGLYNVVLKYLTRVQFRILNMDGIYINSPKDRLITTYHLAGIINMFLNWLHPENHIPAEQFIEVLKKTSWTY
ncbi:TetR family transcriptional regulator [Staphylococcus carnosus]|uniref:HTH tetR-type domain-containing protein n=1 Tax=Staphylococcus carnosus (strain TM300) TaxID=396513 RepID=B9DJ15_STACT|nr:TetR/AcrR family transcriptional regulator [Staphylococcus carnosus]UTB86721.1 hypothetical protein A2I63_00650 [Staphylococcus carnosus]CAL29246.1 hypothetical protein SCA_2343 [Staphylococcus carnosus subsp. carnosus TM300]SUL89154.1 TetR family transcriptional regulator [Staphylococcus carnosus]